MDKVKAFFSHLAADLHPLNRDLENVTDQALTWLANLPYNYLYIVAAIVLLLVV